jgi:hypothetical protein
VTGTNQRHASGTGQRRCRVAGAAAATQAHANRPRAAPPRSRPGAYAPRPGAGPGRGARRTRCQPDRARQVRVRVPAQPPVLTPEAAVALFRILVSARAEPEGGRQMTGSEIGQETGRDR